MEIELIVNRYRISEHKTYHESDAPVPGLSIDKDYGSEYHGPFYTQEEAAIALIILKGKQKKEGWQQLHDQNTLCKHHDYLQYTIEKQPIHLISLPLKKILSCKSFARKLSLEKLIADKVSL